MASSRVMASSSPANSDLARQSSIYFLTMAELQNSISGDPTKNLGSMSVDDLLRNIYGENATAEISPFRESDGGGGAETSLSRQGSFSLPKDIGNKTVEEVWREISGDGNMDGGDGSGYGMTLEDFLARAGAVREEDVRVPSGSVQGVFGLDSDQFAPLQHQSQLETPILGFGNGVERGGGGGGRGKGKKRLALDPVDRVALQRQKRMIKNRESAARSRERKQAYTIELETLVTQLEEQNASLLREQEERERNRLKQLMDNVIPVVDKKNPRSALRRTCSWH